MANERENENNWKTTFLLAGAVIGALLGLGTAYLMARTAEENQGGPPQISTVDALKTGLGVFGLVRSIAALGGGK
ncbi:MAG: hypothetical protein IAE79_16235 [Anaerolinea sp.]|nr:hypothetical protein [Anaerolinea sp.]